MADDRPFAARRSLLLTLTLLTVVVLTTVGAVRPSAPSSAPVHERSPELSWPERRFAACGAVDPDSGTLYAYGGRADDGTTHHGDLWALDPGHGARRRPAWTLVSEAGAFDAPPAVRSCAAAWDPTAGRLIVAGGWNGVTHDGGVRAFDPASGTWSVLCSATWCGEGPGPRRASQLSVDAARHRLLLVGGTDGTYRDDVWSLSLDDLTWSRMPSGPLARGGHSMTIDPDGDALWLFGGTRPGTDLGDLWRFDLVTDTWTELEPACPSGCPAPRSGASLVLDPAGDRLVLYGGWQSSPNTYERAAWTLDDLDGTPVWNPIEPDSEAPQARYFHVAGYDPGAGEMVVFGGGANGSAFKDAFGLTLPPDGTAPRWHTLSPTTGVTARDQVTVVLDDGVLTAFGGFGSGSFPGAVDAGTHLADTWQREIGRRSRWRLATPADESAVPVTREGTAYAHDDAGHRLLVFGGLTGDTTLADTWTVDLSRPGRPQWEQLCSPTSCGQGPSARWGAHAVYDAPGDRFVVFGGATGDGATVDDVWALELSGTPTWHELTPTGPSPAGRWSAAYGYDPVRRRLVVFGGQTGPDASGTARQDAWALSLDGDPAWTELARTGARPDPRRSPASAVRVVDGEAQLVVSMGLTVGTGEHHRDVWSLDLGDDSAEWVELTGDELGPAPSPRRSASAVHDPVHDRLLVTFGRDGERFFDETWSFDLTTHTWHQLPG